MYKWNNYDTVSVRTWKRSKGLLVNTFVAIVSKNGCVTIEADLYSGDDIHFSVSLVSGKRYAERQAQKWLEYKI